MSCMAKGRNVNKVWRTQEQQGGQRKTELAGLPVKVVRVLAGKEGFCFDSPRQGKEGKATPFV